MKIYIPSRSRADTVGASGRTLSFVPPEVQVDVVVNEDQYDAYFLKLRGRPNVEVVPYSGSNLAQKRLFIAERALKLGEPWVTITDDDFRFSRREPGSTKLRKFLPGSSDFSDMLKAVHHLMMSGAGAVGVSARGGNNRVSESLRENTRINGFTTWHTEEFLKCEHDRVPVMEDFDAMLQLLRRGLTNYCIYEFCYDQLQTQSPGGCSDYRTHAMQDEAAQRLAELHPGLVRVRQKRNRGGGDFGKRTEVTISWKKAYEQGVESC